MNTDRKEEDEAMNKKRWNCKIPKCFCQTTHPRKALLILSSAFFLLCVTQYSVILTPPDSMRDSVLATTVLNVSIPNPFWFEPYVDRIARPFVPFRGIEWCHIDTRQSASIQEFAHKAETSLSPSEPLRGFMLTKVHKAGSTTAAGVTLSIAHRVARRRLAAEMSQANKEGVASPSTPMCHSHFYHLFAMENFHSNRNPTTSFLWTTVRLPHRRAESAFYYYHPEHYDDEEEHLKFLSLSRGFQLQLIRKRNERLSEINGNLYLSSGQKPPHQGIPDNSIIITNPDYLALEHVRREVLDHYNFVAVTERWAESMVVLKLLLPGVQYSDLVVLRTKERGAFVRHGLHSCAYIPDVPSPPDRIQTYLDGPFRDTNPDYLLYAAVNRSLDMTIERLGRHRVEEGVRQIQYFQSLAQEHCTNKSYLPCSDDGDFQEGDCYVRDFGCGYKCIGNVLSQQDEENNES